MQTDELSDTGQTIVHRGQVLKILHTVDERAESPFVLETPRGKRYILVRNRPNPAMLFGVAWEGMRTLPGWFTDKDGTLRSCG